MNLSINQDTALAALAGAGAGLALGLFLARNRDSAKPAAGKAESCAASGDHKARNKMILAHVPRAICS